MRGEIGLYRKIFFVVLLGIFGGLSLVAQNGKLKVKVHPPEAYVFVDGQAMGQAYRTLDLSAGNHRIQVVNYGFKTHTQDLTIEPGKLQKIETTLEPVADQVSGPWGCITVEGAPRDAIFLNGKTPEFFVGHGDEFNHEWGVKQELVVPPGNHQLTIMAEGKELWTSAVEVPANQRVVIDIMKGVRKTVPWPRGEQLGALARFKAGVASATVAIAKPTAQMSSQTQQIDCGNSAQLKWSAVDAGEVEITQVGNVSASGEKTVQPKQTTTYDLKAKGPGGIATASTTVNVNSAVRAELALTPAEVHYKQIGPKVIEQPSSALNWTASNVSAVSLEPVGSGDPSGSRALQIMPKKTTPGSVDETVTYTLTASNECGGTETRTATLHLTGSILEVPQVVMSSVYFATDKPTAKKLAMGMVPSQQQKLKKLAEDFKKYLEVYPDAQILLVGHADQRGPKKYNQELSQRRAEVAKSFLIEQGIDAGKVQTQAFGEDKNLTKSEVKQLVAVNPEATEKARDEALRRITTMVYAHNRRVDLQLSRTGEPGIQESVRTYPFGAEEFSVLIQRGGVAPERAAAAGEKGVGGQ